MGDPRKLSKKYSRPKHPWKAERIESERGIVRDYGLKNKREIWKTETLLRGFRGQARSLLALTTEQAGKDEEELLGKLRRLSLIGKDSGLDDVLKLRVNDILERRLQTQVHRKGLANTMKQARQFIIHGHVLVDGGKVTAPSYLIKQGEEEAITLSPNSPIKKEFEGGS